MKRKRKMNPLTKGYVNLSHGVRKHTDPLVRKSREGINIEKGKNAVMPTLRGFWKELKKL